MDNTSYELLHLEDDEPDAVMLEHALRDSRLLRFHLHRVVRLSEALDRLATRDFDAILMDLNVVDSRGLDTFEALRWQAPDTPLVVLTGDQDESVAAAAVAAGAQDYLVKGRDSDAAITRAIHYAIVRSQAVRQLRQRDEQLRLLTQQLPCVFWTTNLGLRFTSFCGADRERGIPAPESDQTLVEYFEALPIDGKMINAHHRAVAGEASTFDVQWADRVYHVHVEPLTSNDESRIGVIALALDVTDQRLLDLELRVTRRVHAGLQPRGAPQLPHFDVAGDSRAAAESGGDYFDYFQLADGSTAIAVCDVAGHGLGPAMMMCQTRSYLRAAALAESDPGELLRLLNHFLCTATDEERLVALLVARLDPEGCEFHYANAGHRGFLVPREGEPTQLRPTTIPLNVMLEMVSEPTPRLKLVPGDLALLYTDGIIEATADDGEPFGTDRMLECILEHRERTAEEIVRRLFERVVAYTNGGRREDDMTAVVVKIVS